MDGVLFDTEKIYEKATIDAAAQLGVEMTSAFFRSTIGTPWPATRTRMIEVYGEGLAIDELHAQSRRIFRELVEAAELLKPGVVELVDLLDGLGVAPASCLALEDSHHGVRAASSAGMMTITVPDLLPCTPEIEGLCLHVVPDLHEVHRLLQAQCDVVGLGPL